MAAGVEDAGNVTCLCFQAVLPDIRMKLPAHTPPAVSAGISPVQRDTSIAVCQFAHIRDLCHIKAHGHPPCRQDAPSPVPEPPLVQGGECGIGPCCCRIHPVARCSIAISISWLQEVEALVRCHIDNPVMKFFNVCAEPKRTLDMCFKVRSTSRLCFSSRSILNI